MIVDEIHGLKKNTARTKHLWYIRHKTRRVLGLTGTPTEGDLGEMHNLLQFVYKKYWIYETTESFSRHYGKKEKLGSNYLLSRARIDDSSPEKYLRQLDIDKIPKYYHLLNRYIHRLNINDEEVRSCMTVPETEAILHKIITSASQGEEYKKYIDEHRDKLIRASQGVTIKHRAEALQLINPLIRLCNSPIHLDLDRLPKIDKVIEIVEEAKGKVIVYCDRVDSAWMCTKALRDKFPQQVIRLYATDEREEISKQSEEERINSVVRFQSDESIRVGVFSINLASQAIDLNQASDIIYYCLPWSSIKIQQSISRPVGPGNPYKVVKIHYLYQEGLIDEYQVLLAVNKIKSARLMMDYEVDINEAEEDLSPTDIARLLLANR